MLSRNIVNPEKEIQGLTFHLFYSDINTAYLYDKSMESPIIWGNKSLVMTKLCNMWGSEPDGCVLHGRTPTFSLVHRFWIFYIF